MLVFTPIVLNSRHRNGQRPVHEAILNWKVWGTAVRQLVGCNAVVLVVPLSLSTFLPPPPFQRGVYQNAQLYNDVWVPVAYRQV